LLFAGSSFLGFAIIGTGTLISGDGNANQMGLLVWFAGTIGASVSMLFALRRTSWAAIICLLPAPLLLALLTGHFVLGVTT
jgi:hypothetical protein